MSGGGRDPNLDEATYLYINHVGELEIGWSDRYGAPCAHGEPGRCSTCTEMLKKARAAVRAKWLTGEGPLTVWRWADVPFVGGEREAEKK